MRGTLKPVLIDISHSGHSESKPGTLLALQNHAGFVPEGSVLIHVDVHGPPFLFVAVKVERSADNQVIPATSQQTEHTSGVRLAAFKQLQYEQLKN